MTTVAILFLICCGLRLLLWLVDDGFGGPIWNAILWISMLGWVFAGFMALHILDLLPKVVWGG